MLERVLYRVLETGLAEVVADPRQVILHFQQRFRLSPVEAQAINDLLSTRRPQIFHAYPRLKEACFPSYWIVLGQEGEAERLLDDGSEAISADEAAALSHGLGLGEDLARDLEGAEWKSSFFTHDFHILCVSDKSPDEAIYLYELAKRFIVRARARGDFIQWGAVDTSLSGGDVAPDERFLPAHLFGRRLTISVEDELQVFGDKPELARPPIEMAPPAGETADGFIKMSAVTVPVVDGPTGGSPTSG